jgi:hypothetical protein
MDYYLVFGYGVSPAKMIVLNTDSRNFGKEQGYRGDPVLPDIRVVLETLLFSDSLVLFHHTLVIVCVFPGAAGLSVPSTVIVGSAGSAVVASVMNICESFYPFLMGSEVADMATEVADMAIEVADISTEEALPNLSNTEKD